MKKTQEQEFQGRLSALNAEYASKCKESEGLAKELDRHANMLRWISVAVVILVGVAIILGFGWYDSSQTALAKKLAKVSDDLESYKNGRKLWFDESQRLQASLDSEREELSKCRARISVLEQACSSLKPDGARESTEAWVKLLRQGRVLIASSFPPGTTISNCVIISNGSIDISHHSLITHSHVMQGLESGPVFRIYNGDPVGNLP